ncbi:MAG: hypothetical protein MK066_01245 [Crocinitomicaceae bacterium]|nr:hypothetical protein [Crocinitomicaceae bacterium]
MTEKKNIVFVVDTLAQHGAERYLFEILKAIDKNKFNPTVLCTYPLNESNNYYEAQIYALGIPIETYSHGELYSEIEHLGKRRLLNAFTYRSQTMLGRKKQLNQRIENVLREKLLGYDIISILKIETFNRFPKIFAEFPNTIIHLLSWGIQYMENPYESLPNRSYQFVTMIESQQDHVKETSFKHISSPDFKFFNFPLILDLENRKNTYEPNVETPIIGVFSRINFDQPTIMFLFAFHSLLKRLPNAKLYFYGKYLEQSIYDFYLQTTKVLGIEKSLHFKGHVPNLQETIIKDEITMGWMNIGNSTLGYSSIEIASFGLPMTFFNIEKHDPSKIDDRLSVFNDMESFVEHSFEVISNEDKIKAESNKTHDFIISNHSAKKRIGELENLLLSLQQ